MNSLYSRRRRARRLNDPNKTVEKETEDEVDPDDLDLDYGGVVERANDEEEKRDRGEVVWFDRLRVRGGRWRWVESTADRFHPDTRGRMPREYLREGIDGLSESAEATAAEVREAANALRAAGRTDGGDALDGDALDRGRDL